MLAPLFFRTPLWVLVALSLNLTAAARELPSVVPESAGMSSRKLEKVDVAVEDLVRQKRLAGATVMVARHGQVVYFKAFGKMNLESEKPMPLDCIFRIHSMTKAITTAAALTLYDDGEIELDKPVSNYLPEFKGLKVWTDAGNVAPSREPTIRDLMRHTAGLTYGFFGDTAVDKLYREAELLDRNHDLKEMCEKLARLPLLYDPGTKWEYSFASDVLGRVIEVVSGMTFDAFLEDRLFLPLGMKDTAFYVPSDKVNRFAASYQSDGKGTLTPSENQPASAYLIKPRFLSGGGGLVSTSRDYMRFLQMIAHGGRLEGARILKPETVALMTHNQLPDALIPIGFGAEKRRGVAFGLGFAVRIESTDWDPMSHVGEYGWDGLASLHYWSSPKDDLVVVTMEQTLPFSFLLETAVKGIIYDAIQ